MNLYLRFFWIIIKSFFARPLNALDESRLQFRVMPTDCDINRHLTNARYLSFMDLGRTYMIGQFKLFPQVIKKGWLPVISACEISFIRALKPLQKFTLVSRIITWDEKYFYFEQRFEVDGEIFAIGLLKGLFLSRGQKITMQEVIQAVNFHDGPPPFPEYLLHWNAMKEAKKN